MGELIASALNTVAAATAKAEARKRPQDQRASPATSKGIRRTSNANDANAATSREPANIAAADEDDFQGR